MDGKLFQKIADILNFGLVVSDFAGKIIYVNDAFARMHGYNISEICGRNIAEFHSQKREVIIDKITSTHYKEGHFSTEDIYHSRKDGDKFPVLLSAFAIKDEKGKPEYFAATTVDITDQKNIQRTLEEYSARYKLLIDNVNSVVAHIDYEGKILFANKAAQAIVGATTEEVTGKNLLEIFYPEFGEALLSDIKSAIDRGTELRHERKLVIYDQEFWADERIVVFPELADCPRSALVISYDITQRKKSEEALKRSSQRYSKLIESCPDGIMVAEVNSRRIIYVNPVFCKIVGLDKEKIIGSHVGDIAGMESDRKRNEANRYFSDTCEKETMRIDNFEIINSDGKKVNLEITSVKDKFNGDAVVIGFFKDITQQVEYGKRLTKQRDELSSLSRRLIEIQEDDRKSIARELHDGIAQHLAAAKMKLECLVETDEEGDKKKLLDDISEMICDAANEIRAISADLRPKILDHKGLIPAMEWYLERSANGLKYDLRVSGDEYFLSPGYNINIFRIFQELLLNIHKHSLASEVQIELEYKPEHFAMNVFDNGRGFSLDKVLNDWAVNLSYGLLNIRERVDLMRGELKIESEHGKGTAFRIKIPRETVR